MPGRTEKAPQRTRGAPRRLPGPPSRAGSLAPGAHAPKPSRLRRAAERALRRCVCGVPGPPGQPLQSRPRAPHAPGWCSAGGRGHPEPTGVCGWPCSAPPRLFPPPRRLATHRDRAGRWALFHPGRGEAGRGAGAERGAGRGGRPCAEGGRRRPATRSRSLEPLGGGGGGSGGRGLQEIQTLRQEIGILTKHSRPAAAPRRGLPPHLTLGPPAYFRVQEELHGVSLLLGHRRQWWGLSAENLGLEVGLAKAGTPKDGGLSPILP